MAKHAPSREEVQNSRWLRPFGKRIRQSDLWRFTRRSVPRGVAIGLFVGIFLMVPGLQIVGAALVCMALRGNVADRRGDDLLVQSGDNAVLPGRGGERRQPDGLPRRPDDASGPCHDPRQRVAAG